MQQETVSRNNFPELAAIMRSLKAMALQ